MLYKIFFILIFNILLGMFEGMLWKFVSVFGDMWEEVKFFVMLYNVNCIVWYNLIVD